MHETLVTVREFVLGELNGAVVGDDEDIFATGYVSSLFVIQLVMFVEQRFDVAVVGDDLDIDNFRTIADITRFVASRLGDRVTA